MDSEGISEKGIRKLPSRFLNEIGEDNYKRIGVISDELMNDARKFIKRTDNDQPVYSYLPIGEEVNHHVFGKGRIVGYDQKHGSYVIMFDRFNQTRNITKSYFDRERDLIALKDIEATSEDAINTPVGKAETDPKEVAVEQTEVFDKNDTLPEKNEEEKEEFEKGKETDVFRITDIKQGSGGSGQQPKSSQNDNQQDDFDADALNRQLEKAENLWNKPEVPKTGWTCTGVTDLGSPSGICQMCGHQIIRYVHHMVHPQYGLLDVGCVCAGKMEGDENAARRREQDFKNKQARFENYQKKPWKQSAAGNPYLKIKQHIVVIYYMKKINAWKYSVDNKFCIEAYQTKEEAIKAAFEELDRIMNQEKKKTRY